MFFAQWGVPRFTFFARFLAVRAAVIAIYGRKTLRVPPTGEKRCGRKTLRVSLVKNAAQKLWALRAKNAAHIARGKRRIKIAALSGEKRCACRPGKMANGNLGSCGRKTLRPPAAKKNAWRALRRTQTKDRATKSTWNACQFLLRIGSRFSKFEK